MPASYGPVAGGTALNLSGISVESRTSAARAG